MLKQEGSEVFMSSIEVRRACCKLFKQYRGGSVLWYLFVNYCCREKDMYFRLLRIVFFFSNWTFRCVFYNVIWCQEPKVSHSNYNFEFQASWNRIWILVGVMLWGTWSVQSATFVIAAFVVFVWVKSCSIVKLQRSFPFFFPHSKTLCMFSNKTYNSHTLT